VKRAEEERKKKGDSEEMVEDDSEEEEGEELKSVRHKAKGSTKSSAPSGRKKGKEQAKKPKGKAKKVGEVDEDVLGDRSDGEGVSTRSRYVFTSSLIVLIFH
jgi:hypothetical protein